MEQTRLKEEFHKIHAIVKVENFLWKNSARPDETYISLFETIFHSGEIQGPDAPILNRCFSLALYRLFSGYVEDKAHEYLKSYLHWKQVTNTAQWIQREKEIIASYNGDKAINF